MFIVIYCRCQQTLNTQFKTYTISYLVYSRADIWNIEGVLRLYVEIRYTQGYTDELVQDCMSVFGNLWVMACIACVLFLPLLVKERITGSTGGWFGLAEIFYIVSMWIQIWEIHKLCNIHFFFWRQRWQHRITVNLAFYIYNLYWCLWWLQTYHHNSGSNVIIANRCYMKSSVSSS